MYINEKIANQSISFSAQKGIIGSIKLFYRYLYKREIDIDYIYPDMQNFKLPNVLSQEDIKMILQGIRNLKHKAIIS